MGRLRSPGNGTARCDSCAAVVNGAMLKTLEQVAALPDALGTHPCECGHPEMRLLPDGTFHCPGCGSEVLSIDASSTFAGFDGHGEAYRAGWVDGRFGRLVSFVDNPNLARWEEPSDRLDYYRGHRAGSEARWAKGSSDPEPRDEVLRREGA